MDKTNKPKVSQLKKAYLKALKEFQDNNGQIAGQHRDKTIGYRDKDHTPLKGVLKGLFQESLKSHVEEVK